MDEFCKRTWTAIDELEACVKEQAIEEDEDEAYHTRVHTAAMTMAGLGLGLEALGALALCLSEIEKIIEEDNKEEDNKEEKSEPESDSESHWPETIG